METKPVASRDLESNIDFVQSIAPASQAAAVNGASVDLRDYASAMVLISAGAAGGTTPSFTFEVQESSDNATFTAVADEHLQGAEPVVTAGNEVHRIGYRGSQRYIRVTITAVSGTSPTLDAEAGVVRGRPHQGPL
jgi:gamma-glutamyl:cysteine ligase YbdK (ATP-grasp superfamily)